MTRRIVPRVLALVTAFVLAPAAASAATPERAVATEAATAVAALPEVAPKQPACALTEDAKAGHGKSLEGQLNANEANAEQWDLLPGIGPATAARILEYVRRHPIKHTSQLMRVKGIGRKTYERIRPYLVLQGPTTLQPAGA